MASNIPSETDVLVVGAGPTGLTLANELCRRQIRCRIIDKYDDFPTTSRALGLQARTREIFDAMGIAEAIIAHGATVMGVSIRQGNRVVASLRLSLECDARPDEPYRGVLIENQAVIESILREHLASLGGEVQRSHELLTFVENGDSILATVANRRTGETEEIRAGYLVGCDGAHSTVRKRLGLTFEGAAYDEYFVLGDLEMGTPLPADTSVVWLNDEGLLAAIPFPQGQLWRLIATVSPNSAGDVPPASIELFQQLLRRRAGDTTTRLGNAVWLSNFKVNRRIVNHYRQGPAFVAGDAAHIHSPAGGQGMNTGIQDAYNLAWKLALVVRGEGQPNLLDTYEEERMPIGRLVLASTDKSTKVILSRNPVFRMLRDHLLVPILELPGVFDALIHRGSELDLNYRGAALAEDHVEPLSRTMLPSAVRREGLTLGDWLAFLQAPHAGDRAPDGHCQIAATREPTTLFHQLRDPRFALLLFSGTRRPAAQVEPLRALARLVEKRRPDAIRCLLIVPELATVDPVGGDGSILLDFQDGLHTTYGARAPALYLIRPDGYIGFRSQPVATEPLLQYLSRIFKL